ncbi:putative pyridoxal phosphate-dependent aminotransferase EpsN [bacterium BMS3Abin10]|nr:putative pyridoxal phosphate-dependent aminotransferase EpsN [bacterium BMS3Abin10]GBE39912.1 putative pyridoxal phosphate-dependent aminotransferase EpsN [bacterium BMS3Bbin08]
MTQNIPLSEPVFRGNEWKYIKECLDTGWVSSAGSFVERFENTVAEYTGCTHAVATVNGTSALHVSLVANGITYGDEVIVPTLTFVAPVNAVRYCGADPVFMDCDKDTLCMDVEKLKGFLEENTYIGKDNLTYNKNSKKPVKAIIPVHVFGHPSDMDSLLEIAGQYNLIIIEDASESLGSEYKGRKAGSFGHIGCFSFNGNKIVTSGGGGMVVTNNEILAKKIRHLTTQARTDPFEYDHDEVGYNYRLTNIQAAMGVAQMEKLDEFVSLKRKNAMLYRDMLAGLDDVEFLWEKAGSKSNFWMYTIRVHKEHKKALIEYLLAKNIQVRPIWKLMHTLPMYKGFQVYAIDKAIKAYESCINLPCSVSLKQEEVEYVSNNIANYFLGLKR